MIKILYFARFREQLATESEQLQVAPEIRTLADVTQQLKQRGGAWADVFGADETVLTALNQELASPDAPVSDGDEIAYFPPVTGG